MSKPSRKASFRTRPCPAKTFKERVFTIIER